MKTSTDHEAAAQLDFDVQVGVVLTHIEYYCVCGLARGDIEDHPLDRAPGFEPFLYKVPSAPPRKWLAVSGIDHLFRSPVVGHFPEFRQCKPSLLQQPDELVSDITVPVSHNTPQLWRSLEAQPPAQPHSRVVVEHPIRFAVVPTLK